MSDAFLYSAVRTPVGKYLGGLAEVSAPQLGAVVIAEAMRRAKVAGSQVDEVIMGSVLQAGVGQNPARQAALKAGLPDAIAAFTVNKVCGSGLKAVMLAAQAIRAGDAELIVAGGMESMSRAPYLLFGARIGWKYGDQKAVDAMIHDGLWCAFEDWHMGAAAEHIAFKCGVSRAEQDRFSVQSHQRAAAAWDGGAFDAEVIPVLIRSRPPSVVSLADQGEEVYLKKDEGIRRNTSVEQLSKLKPSFVREQSVSEAYKTAVSGWQQPANEPGTVTAGNSSMLSDGAAAAVVGSESATRRFGIKPLARIVAYTTSGIAPKDIFLAPVSAVRQVLDKAGLTPKDIDLFELNEAFAAQMLACNGELKLDEAKLNVNGGAIALGHPIGASGTRVLVTLLHALEQRGLKRGLAALCLGGGNAVAMVVERV